MKSKDLLLSDIGEQALIQKIRRWCGKDSSTVPLGDDAFVAKLDSYSPIVITTDTLIEKTHFDLGWLQSFLTPAKTWQALGYKALAINLSDLAAMGNVAPKFAFVTLGNRGDISVNSVDNLYRGMLKAAKEYDFKISGGDLIRSEKSMISVTVVGKLLGSKPIRRSGAKFGDILMASGPLGLSAMGLKILKNKEKLTETLTRKLISSHLYPRPKFEISRILSNDDIMATSLMDTSDDLIFSLKVLSQASSVGFKIDLNSIPLPRFFKQLPPAWDPYDFFLYGGEDYELLFTVPPKHVPDLLKKIPWALIIGRVTSKVGKIEIFKDGKPYRIKSRGFKHF